MESGKWKTKSGKRKVENEKHHATYHFSLPTFHLKKVCIFFTYTFLNNFIEEASICLPLFLDSFIQKRRILRKHFLFKLLGGQSDTSGWLFFTEPSVKYRIEA